MTVRSIDANALQELCNRRIQDTWNSGTAPVSWAEAYADFKDDIDSIPTLTPPNKPRMINADKLAKRIAGHSNYHGYSILAAIYCAAEGKENDVPIRPIETPQNEWISVDKRLPDGHAQVLMWSAKWNIAEAGSYYNKHFWVHNEIGDAYIADDITYWMLLPEPPAKVDES